MGPAPVCFTSATAFTAALAKYIPHDFRIVTHVEPVEIGTSNSVDRTPTWFPNRGTSRLH